MIQYQLSEVSFVLFQDLERHEPKQLLSLVFFSAALLSVLAQLSFFQLPNKWREKKKIKAKWLLLYYTALLFGYKVP